MSIGLIIGVVVGVLAVIFIMGGLLYYKLKTRVRLDKLPEAIRAHYQPYYDSSGGMDPFSEAHSLDRMEIKRLGKRKVLFEIAEI